MSQTVEVRGLDISFDGHPAVRNVDLSIAAGEFFTLLGSSGSGKTTTLMAIAGFARPDRGDVLIGGRSVLDKPPERRGLGVVFQSYALFPTMNVARNVGFPLRMRGVRRAEIADRVREALAMVHLERFATYRVAKLSGGQQQRVALARALVFRPPVLLMDEPLGALDRQLREELQGEIRGLQRSLGITVCYVTHDQDEALSMSDRIAVMADGRLQQVGPPAALYERPANLFVARFLGESNAIACRVTGRDGVSARIELGPGLAFEAPLAPGAEPVTMVLRPESLRIGPAAEHGGGGVPGRLETIQYLGASVRIGVQGPLGALTLRMPRDGTQAGLSVGDAVHVRWAPTEACFFDRAGQAI